MTLSLDIVRLRRVALRVKVRALARNALFIRMDPGKIRLENSVALEEVTATGG